MKNRKALVGEGMSIVLAVLGLVLLLYLSVGLYGIFANSAKTDQAVGTLNEVEGALKGFDAQGKNNVLVLTPKDWYFYGVLVGGGSMKTRTTCPLGKNCLCFCEKEPEDCGQKGVCKVIEYAALVCEKLDECKELSYVEIDELMEFFIYQDGEVFLITREEK